MTNLVAATLEANKGVDVLVNASRDHGVGPAVAGGDGLEATLDQNVLGDAALDPIVSRRMIELAEPRPPPDPAIVTSLGAGVRPARG